MAPLSLNFCNRWKCEWSMSRSGRFIPGERTLVPTDVEAWWGPGPVWREDNALRPGFKLQYVKYVVTIQTLVLRDASRYGCGPTGMHLFCMWLEKFRKNKMCHGFRGFGWESKGLLCETHINRQCHRKSNLSGC